MNKVFLSDCIEYLIDNRGVTPHKKGVEWTETGIPVLSANNVKTSGLVCLDEIRYVPNCVYSKWMKKPLEKGDILLTSEAPAGEVYYWNSDTIVIVGQRLYGLKIKKSINSLYLKYYLQSTTGQKAIQTQQSGSTVFGISEKTFKNIIVFLPEKDYQDKAANILFNIDKKISNNLQINKLLESMIRTIYDFWFLQFEFPNEQNKPYKSSGGKMTYNEELKREIPEGWEVKELLDLVEWNSNSQPPKSEFVYQPKEGYIRFIQNRDYESDNNLTYIPFKKSLHKVNETDILIDKYGDAGRVRYGISGVFNVALAHIKVKNQNNLEYIRSFLENENIYLYLHNSCIASTRASLSEDNLKQIYLVLPTNSIIDKFQNLVSNIRHFIISNIRENKQLTSLRDFLLPLLMNGQIKI